MKKQVLAVSTALFLSAICLGAMRTVPARAAAQETAAVAICGTVIVQQNQVPELPSYTDPVMTKKKLRCKDLISVHKKRAPF